MNLFDLKGKVAIVTGAGSGLGKDAALAYADAGADVALLDIRENSLHNVKEKINSLGRDAISIGCDITNEVQVKRAVQTTLDYFGHIDILLNNAGIAIGGGVENMTEEMWNKSFDVNVKSMFFTCKYVVPHMKQRHYGKIINISSVNAVVADKYDSLVRHSYNASKAAVLGLTTGMACSYAQYGITVNAIGPALFKTGMTEHTLFRSEAFLQSYNHSSPAGRPARQGELNGTILYLSSDASSYVQGQFIVVDGGSSLV